MLTILETREKFPVVILLRVGMFCMMIIGGLFGSPPHKLTSTVELLEKIVPLK